MRVGDKGINVKQVIESVNKGIQTKYEIEADKHQKEIVKTQEQFLSAMKIKDDQHQMTVSDTLNTFRTTAATMTKSYEKSLTALVLRFYTEIQFQNDKSCKIM